MNNQEFFIELDDKSTDNPQSVIISRKWHDNGQIRAEYYSDGTKRTYYINGQIKSELIPHAITRSWDMSGVLRAETFSNGYQGERPTLERLVDGAEIEIVNREWDASGKIIKLNLADGTTMFFQHDGQLLKMCYSIRNGGRTGHATYEWYSSGRLRRENVEYNKNLEYAM